MCMFSNNIIFCYIRICQKNDNICSTPPYRIMIDADIVRLLDAYFLSGGNTTAPVQLVKHQIDSFNEFLENKIEQIIQGFNPIRSHNNYCETLQDYKQKLHIYIQKPRYSKPIYKKQDGTQVTMTPYMARLDNLTYSVDIYVSVHIIAETYDDTEKIIITNEKVYDKILLGKIPIMVGSKACMLTLLPNIEGEDLECKYETGGYFIVNGNEKVLISQDRIQENYPLVFKPTNPDVLNVEIRSMPDFCYLPPKTMNLLMSTKPNHMGRVIRVSTSFLKNDIPVFVLFRALGIETDQDIIKHILYDIDDVKNHNMLMELRGCVNDANDIYTIADAKQAILRNMTSTVTRTPKTLENLDYSLKHDLIPHVCGYQRKALYIGYMIRKLIRIYLGYSDYDNRDSYINKRIDTPGILMSTLFRQCYGKMTKDMKASIEKDMNVWRSNSTPLNQIINDKHSIIRCFKNNLLDSWIKYALSTGNWGIKSIGSYQNIKQGVSQVLSRMSYNSTLSHMRRINTAMEKNGKLVQPRKLDISHFGVICPSETPEGAPVGLVKNMALSTNISNHMCSVYIRTLLINEGTIEYTDNMDDISGYLDDLANPKHCTVMVNGDIIGYHMDPPRLYSRMIHFKRSCKIYPMTSIVWTIDESIISIRTEGGRMYRPLLIVDDYKYLRFKRYIEKYPQLMEEGVPFEAFLNPRVIGIDEEEGCVEYLDIDEIDHSMIAMHPVNLKKDAKGNNMNPNYSHCEIHPSLINGVLGVNVPFSDHNQAPRNTYQAAMSKQALGIYTTNFYNRMDTVGNILNYPQKSLLNTMLSKYTYRDNMPSGVNTIVAIVTYTGFNQEDSVMINKSAVDRGLFCSTHYRCIKDICSKNHSTGEEEVFTKPENIEGVYRPFNYDKIDHTGFVPPNTYVGAGDVIIGKIMPRKNADGKISNIDCSTAIKPSEEGFIDLNYSHTNTDGYKFCKIRMRNYRRPEIGDKLASQIAQKGSIGMLFNQEDMPFTKDGLVPDVMMNPHAIPSRMTIAQVMESVLGKSCCIEGVNGDCTPYSGVSVEEITDRLEANGMEKYGNEVMYDPRTGQQMQTSIFIGPTYYQRLKHMSADKVHCLTPGHDVLTYSDGWKPIHEVTMEDMVAVLKSDGKMVYEQPLDIHQYLDYSGKIYKVTSSDVDIEVTMNHRMYIKHKKNEDYSIHMAQDIKSCVYYKKNAKWNLDDLNINTSIIDLYAIWFCYGKTSTSSGLLFMIDKMDDSIIKLLNTTLENLDIMPLVSNTEMEVFSNDISYYIDTNIKRFPWWVWCMSEDQCRRLIRTFKSLLNNMDNSVSSVMADDFMRLSIHAGLSCNKKKRWDNTYTIHMNTKPDMNEPLVLRSNTLIYDYKGPVYCLTVSSGVFMVRRNGKNVWTGNSRGSNGPTVFLTRQPTSGKKSGGGLKKGEMERDAVIAHGASTFLKERMLDASDNSRQYICKNCGCITVSNSLQQRYECQYCDVTDVCQIRIPYAFKLFSQELQAMNIQLRYKV